MKFNDINAITKSIADKWPKFEIKIFEDPKEDTFRIDFGNDYTSLWVCYHDLKSEKPIFAFINHGNDEIKDSTAYKKYFDFDSSDEIKAIIGIIELVLLEYAISEYESWKPSNDELEKLGIDDPIKGSHDYEIIEEVTGIPYK